MNSRGHGGDSDRRFSPIAGSSRWKVGTATRPTTSFVRWICWIAAPRRWRSCARFFVSYERCFFLSFLLISQHFAKSRNARHILLHPAGLWSSSIAYFLLSVWTFFHFFAAYFSYWFCRISSVLAISYSSTNFRLILAEIHLQSWFYFFLFFWLLLN